MPGWPAESRVAPVAIYTQFQQDPPELVLEALKEELASVTSPIGVPFEWKSLAAARGNETSAHLMVVVFKGRCDVAGLDPLGPPSGSLGWTHVSDGVILPFTDVDCDGIRRFLRRRLAATDVEQRERVYGRAIGRVLAHEFYHIFANTQHHASSGVAEPVYNEDELASDDFRFHESELRALWTAIESRGAIRAAAGSPQAGRILFSGNGCQACHGSAGEGTARGSALRTAKRPFEYVDLALQLRNDTSKMVRRSRELKIPLPTLSESNIEDLISFLNQLAP